VKRIKLSSNWASSQDLTSRLVSQFATSTSDLTVEFVYDDSYDLIVYFNHVTEYPLTDSILLPQEPSWSGNHQKTFSGYKNMTVYGYDKNLYTLDCNFVEYVALMFYGGRGPSSEGWNNWSYNNLKNKVFEKSLNICSTVSNLGLNWKEFPDSCLYKQRNTLIQNLTSTSFIDFYGGWEGAKNLKGTANKKYDILSNYKFCLTIENSNEKNYVSEKFYDCILTNTIPIYYGCKNIKDLWPENGYFLLDNIENEFDVKKLITYINDNSESIYNEMLPELLKMKERYFNQFNPLKKICQI